MTSNFIMRTLEDIREFRDNQYGLAYVSRTFESEKNIRFSGAEREWKSLLISCDEILKNRHSLDVNNEDDAREWYELPFLYSFRNAYLDVLHTLPDTIEECRSILSDALITLKTVEEMDRITPYIKPHQQPDSILEDLCDNHLSDAHIGSAAANEKECLARLNARADRRNVPPLTPWEPRTLKTILDRKNVGGRRLSMHGTGQTFGHFVVRETADPDKNGFDLIAFNACERPGVSDMLAKSLMEHLEDETQKRVRNLVEKSH